MVVYSGGDGSSGGDENVGYENVGEEKSARSIRSLKTNFGCGATTLLLTVIFVHNVVFLFRRPSSPWRRTLWSSSTHSSSTLKSEYLSCSVLEPYIKDPKHFAIFGSGS